MDPLYLTAASGLRSRLESLELLSNNLANTNTAGYKKDAEFYGLYRSQVMNEDPDGADPATPSLPFIQRPWTDFSQGTIERTGNAGDLALSGKGFFAVQSPNSVLYTRNGHFRLSADGQIQTAEGYALLGQDGQPVNLTPGREFQVDPDGTIKQGQVTIGKIQLAAFQKEDTMVKQGHSYFRTDETPGEATECSVLQNSAENSNVPVAESAIRLVGLTRQFEMLNRAVTVCGQMGQMAVQELGKING